MIQVYRFSNNAFSQAMANDFLGTDTIGIRSMMKTINYKDE